MADRAVGRQPNEANTQNLQKYFERIEYNYF